MGDYAIEVDTLGKRYMIGPPRTVGMKVHAALKRLPLRRSNVRRVLSKLMPRQFPPRPAVPPPPVVMRSEFWALRNVSFKVKRGEVLGIVGRNGAGKSTLLKILSRITAPTEGRAIIRGQVGSLLEVGTGFHPDLSGRENIYLNGVTLGLTHREIERRFQEIVDFAEIEQFIDTPVKHYSSGMYMRLAFAVAAHLTADVMLIDEVLAVGDAAFQRKCLGKMESFTHHGRTILFVSHSLSAIESFCTRCILLDNGQLAMDDVTSKVSHEFMDRMGVNPCKPTAKLIFEEEPANRMQVLEAELLPVQDKPEGEVMPMRFRYRVRCPRPDVLFCIDVKNAAGVSVYYANDESLLDSRKRQVGVHDVVCFLPVHLLAPGGYHVRFGIWAPPAGEPEDFPDKALSFTRRERLNWSGRLASHGIPWPSVIYQPSRWSYVDTGVAPLIGARQ